MRVLINQTPCELADNATLADAIQAVAANEPYAAALNLNFVPRGRHAQTPLAEGDHIEIIAPVSGG
ncbi:MAG: sulfur carrier protein ThiS [Chromatiaceae bacterium]|nr:sulfur carrier protein ThiS [Chromatiaceae bacterium]